MQGLHLTADCLDCCCDSRWLTDADWLGQRCRAEVVRVGLQPMGELFFSFPASACGAGGVTATVLLAESHLCLHTWPELRGITLDIYVCNFGSDQSGRAQALLERLLALFAPGRVERHRLLRGGLTDAVPTAPVGSAQPFACRTVA